MGNGGLSKARLGRMREIMAGYVERGELPGLVALISRRGEVHAEALGAQALGGAPMRRDTIFRIASMTKPITAAAALILMEECRLRLDEPVDRLLPELANRRVLKQIDGPLDDTVPANRPITVRDLLTFRLGLGMVMAPPGTYPIQQAMSELQLDGPPSPARVPPPDEWMRRLGTLPLIHQPGERWMYHIGSEVLGVLVERAAGQPLEAFMRERIFEPLGMKDTGFSVPEAKIDRLATCYWSSGDALHVFDEAAGGQWSRPPAFASGGGGLVSTIDDYLAFGQMLLDGGRCGRGRILSRHSVAAMTADQLTPAQKAASGQADDYFDSHGWGFGVSVVTRHTSPAEPVGQFGWDGGLGTSWRSDPQEGMVAILLTQRSWASASPPGICLDFWPLAYQAIDD